MDNRIVRLSFILTILLIGLFSMSYAFADEPATVFHLVHYLNINPEYHFEFKNESGVNSNSVVLEPSTETQEIASLYLIHNRDVVVKSITVSATDLMCGDVAYPYTMIVEGVDDSAVQWVANPQGNGSGSATIISGSYKFKYSQTRGSVKFAVFSIILDDADVPTGVYEGTMTLEHVVL